VEKLNACLELNCSNTGWTIDCDFSLATVFYVIYPALTGNSIRKTAMHWQNQLPEADIKLPELMWRKKNISDSTHNVIP